MILFLLLSIVGLIASVVVHFSTFGAGVTLTMKETWPLHVGIFLVFIPAAATERRSPSNNAREEKKQLPLREQFPDAPRWMHWLFVAFFVYAIVNFLVFMVFDLTTRRHPRYQGGQYGIFRNGKLVEPVTEQEFRLHQTKEVRGGSGHWM